MAAPLPSLSRARTASDVFAWIQGHYGSVEHVLADRGRRLQVYVQLHRFIDGQRRAYTGPVCGALIAALQLKARLEQPRCTDGPPSPPRSTPEPVTERMPVQS